MGGDICDVRRLSDGNRKECFRSIRWVVSRMVRKLDPARGWSNRWRLGGGMFMFGPRVESSRGGRFVAERG